MHSILTPPFSEAALLVRACNQLGQFLSHRETNLRYLALETMCLLATSEFSHEAVKKHQETVINSLKVGLRGVGMLAVALSALRYLSAHHRKWCLYKYFNFPISRGYRSKVFTAHLRQTSSPCFLVFLIH